MDLNETNKGRHRINAAHVAGGGRHEEGGGFRDGPGLQVARAAVQRVPSEVGAP
jgi:hypothetical protein